MQYFRRRFVRLTQKANKMFEKKATQAERDPGQSNYVRQVYPQ